MDANYQSVSDLTDAIKFTLNEEFTDVWVSGEVSGLSTPQSGHVYLTLKDPTAQISTVIWRSTAERLRFIPENGMQVLCRGYVDVYPQRGTFQLIVRSIQPLGQGALQIAFRKLHDRLKAEGLFDDQHKRSLPRFPRRIAVITSPSGAAVHDFLQVATRRWPHFEILIVPTQVQGPDAAAQIARAIQWCGQKKCRFHPDVIVVTRGGGSIEDLWSFNEEPVVRAIHKCKVPVISAVGHEIDVTLSDLVADVRALTPSEAGEIIAPPVEDVHAFMRSSALRIQQAMRTTIRQHQLQLDTIAGRPSIRQPLSRLRNLALQVDSLDTKLVHSSRRHFEATRQRLDRCFDLLAMTLKTAVPQARGQLDQLLAKTAFRQPLNKIAGRKQQLQIVHDQLNRVIAQQIRSTRQSIVHVEEMLNAYNPTNILNRGYSLTLDADGKAINDCENVRTGDKITTWLRHGKLSSTVDTTDPAFRNDKDGQKEN